MAIKANFPDIKPSLNLDFANTKRLDPRITFTRASTATYYDGKTVAKAEENLVQYSQEFDNAVWSKTNVTVTADNTTAPDGTTTAELITENVTGSATGIFITQDINAVIGNEYTISVFAKRNGRDFQIAFGSSDVAGNPYANFDLSTGTLGTTGGTITASITAAGNSWYRCSVTITSAVTSLLTVFVVSDSTSASRLAAHIGDGTSGLYLWGAQVEQRSSVTAYTPTTTQPITNYIPVLQSAASGEARFDHDPVTGESLGLLIEEQRTNLALRSEEFDNASWVTNTATVTPNTIVAPDGSLTGDALVETTANGNSFITQTVTVSASTVYTTSVYAKTNGRVLQITFGTGDVTGNPRANYDLSAGVLGTVDSGITATITPVGNGWYRCTATVTSAVTSFRPIFANVSATTSARVASYQGDGYSGIYIWGAQLEAGAFPTSYIPTTSATVTRAADAASMTGTNFSSWYRTDEGTLFAENKRPLGSRGSVSIDDGTNNNRILLSNNIDNSNTLLITLGGSGQLNASIGTNSQAFDKFDFAYKTNDIAGSQNGGAVGTYTSLIPAVNALRLGVVNGSPGQCYYKRISYYPARLTNAELQGLTS